MVAALAAYALLRGTRYGTIREDLEVVRGQEAAEGDK